MWSCPCIIFSFRFLKSVSFERLHSAILMSASANSAAMSGQLQKWFPALYNEKYRNKLLQRGKNWSVSIGIALGTLGFAVVYFTEWRDIMEKVPVLKSKFEGKPREQ